MSSSITPIIPPEEPDSNPFNLATHNGYITVENPKTGEHRTFRVSSENWDDNIGIVRVVALLIGPERDDYRNWLRFAFVKDSGQVRCWKRFHGTEYEKFCAILSHPERGMDYGLVYHFEGRCRRCNRPLTHPESIKSGIGPVCAGKE